MNSRPVVGRSSETQSHPIDMNNNNTLAYEKEVFKKYAGKYGEDSTG
jgi:hypothetical protein